MFRVLKLLVCLTFFNPVASATAVSGPLKCQTMKLYKSNCSEFTGQNQKKCQVCRAERSCFIAFDGVERQFCEAYWEGKSCFMAFSKNSDVSWCQHLKEHKSCFMALNGKDRNLCEEGKYPGSHTNWMI